MLSLAGSAPVAQVDITELCATWEVRSAAERATQCAGLARKLTQQRRARTLAISPRNRAPLASLFFALFAFVLGGVYWVSPYGPGQVPAVSPADAAQAAPQPTQERSLPSSDQRALRVCESTRSRVLRGATLGPMDVEGWVVEIALMRAGSLGSWSELEPFLRLEKETEKSRVVWKDAPELSQIEGYATGLSVSQTRVSADALNLQQLVVTLHGGYVKAYFSERQRIFVVRLAHGLAKAFSASHGAVYGRCQHGESHHLGSWFVGDSPSAAAVSLLYFMGARAQPAFLPSSLLSPNGHEGLAPAFAIQSLGSAANKVGRNDIAKWIGSQDGTVAGRSKGFTSIQFPYVDSNRALRASRSVTRALKLAESPSNKL